MRFRLSHGRAAQQADRFQIVRRPDGAYDRLEERQVQRAHTRKELRGWLQEAGFAGIRFYGRQRMTPPRTGSCA